MNRESGPARQRVRSQAKSGGQSLIEVLLALGVAVVIITAITSTIVVALDNASFSKNQNLATTYAQEGMEFVRTLRDRNFSNIDINDVFCLPEGGTVLITKSPDTTCNPKGFITGGFIREIAINETFAECGDVDLNRKVTVTVSWLDGKCSPANNFCHRARIISCLGRPDISAP